MAKLESLVVDLQVNTAALRKGLDEANAKLESFGKSMSKLGSVAEFAAVGHLAKQATERLVEFVLKGSEAADAMGKMAKAAGVPVEAFSQLAYAANLGGVDAEAFGGAMKHLNKTLAEAGAGGKDQAAIFRALGVSVKDAGGAVRPADQVFKQLADRFNGLKDGASKSALQMAIFGKEGAKLNGVFEGGAAGLAKLAAESDRFGATISAQAAASTAEFNDNLTRLGVAANAVAVRVAADLAPSLTALTTQLLNSKEGADFLKGAAEVLATTLRLLASGGVIVAAVFEALGTNIARVASAVVNAATGNFAAAFNDTRSQVDDVAKTVVQTVGRIKAIWSDGTGAEQAFEKQSQAAKKSADEVLKQAGRIKKGLAEARSLSDFELGRKTTAIDQQAGTARANYKGIGASPEQFFARMTAGFASFDQALTEYTARTVQKEAMIAEAALARKAGDEAYARELLLASDKFSVMADRAKLASDGFMQVAQAAAALQQAQTSMTKSIDGLLGLAIFNASGGSTSEQLGAAGNLGSHFAGKMGKVGDVANTALQGFQAGGIWGAIIAAIAELLSSSKQFQQLIDTWNDELQIIADAFGGALDGINELAEAMKPMTQALAGFIQKIVSFLGVVSGVGKIGQILAPIVNAVIMVLDIIGTVIDAFSSLADSLSIFDFVIAIIAGVLNLSSLTVLGTIQGIQGFWGWILGIVHGIMKALSLDTTGIEQMYRDNEANRRATQEKMTRIWENIWDPNANAPDKDPEITSLLGDVGISVEQFGTSVDSATLSIGKFTEQFTNLPQGFKIRRAQFGAQDPLAMGDMSGRHGDINLYVSGGVMTTLDQITEAVRKAAKSDRFRKYGTEVGG